MPTKVTLLLPLKTGEPLSPAPRRADTRFWQKRPRLVPLTAILTQLLVTLPVVQPVVRPTLPTTWPTAALPSAVTLRLPLSVIEPLFGPVVFAIRPNVDVVAAV